MKKLTILFLLLSLSVFTLKAQTPLTTAVDFTVTDTEGHSFNLFNKLGENKFVCIDFFYTGCVPCQGAAPKISQAYQHFGCNSSNVYFIGMDYGDNTASVLAFDASFGVLYPTVSGVEGGGTAVCTAYGITAYPTVILIAPNHSIVAQDIWPINTYMDVVTPLTTAGCIAASCPTGINEQPVSGISAYLFPNPTRDNATLAMEVKESCDVKISILDLTGRVVLDQPVFKMFPGNQNIKLNTESLANGLYYVNVSADNKRAEVFSLSISR
ncbi:MAG: T9SS type A sorting domain-containing protein [Bacteroidota bacterium]